MADNSKILLGLPNLPADTIDPKLWGEFLTIYRAMQNLLNGVSEYTGIDGPDALEIANMDPTKYLLAGNATRYYPRVSQPTTRGQLLNIYNNSGTAWARLANATNPSFICHGIANQTVGNNDKCEVIMFQGLTTAIGGMTSGTQYYLSTTPGAIQNLPPVAAGQVVQGIGVALTAGQLLLNIAGPYRQL